MQASGFMMIVIGALVAATVSIPWYFLCAFASLCPNQARPNAYGERSKRHGAHYSISHSVAISSCVLRAWPKASPAAGRSLCRMRGDFTSHTLSTQALHHCALRREARMGLSPTGWPRLFGLEILVDSS